MQPAVPVRYFPAGLGAAHHVLAHDGRAAVTAPSDAHAGDDAGDLALAASPEALADQVLELVEFSIAEQPRIVVLQQEWLAIDLDALGALERRQLHQTVDLLAADTPVAQHIALVAHQPVGAHRAHALAVQTQRVVHRFDALRDQLPGLARPAQPLRILAVADQAPVCAGHPAVALAADRGLHALALGVAFFVGADHHQERVDQVHRLGLEGGAVVLAAVAGRDHGDAGVDDLRELRLRLDGFGAAETVEAFDNQYGARRDAAFIHRLEENAEGALLYVPLVVGRQALVAQRQRFVQMQPPVRRPGASVLRLPFGAVS